MTLALALVAGACGGGDDAGGGSDAGEGSQEEVGGGDVTTVPEDTTPPPSSGVPEGQLPFVTCGPATPAASGDATLSVLDPTTGVTAVVQAGLQHVCNGNGTLTNTTLSSSRRYLVSIWPRFTEAAHVNVVDLSSGRQVDVVQDRFDAWATAQTGTGLDAEERELELGGVDRTGDGRLFLLDDSGDGRVWYEQKISDLVASNGVPSPTKLPDDRACYAESSYWSPDGAYCIHDQEFVPASLSSADALERYNTGGSDHAAGVIWLDGTTVVGGSSSKTVQLDRVGNVEETSVYEVSGDRDLGVWADSGARKLYLTSATLDGSAVEVYALDPVSSGSTPRLIATVPGKMSTIST